jgi:hypothetical protein
MNLHIVDGVTHKFCNSALTCQQHVLQTRTLYLSIGGIALLVK